jgi:hypothetical protein
MLQITQLNTLISLLLVDLTHDQRQKIMTICTIDVHSRDVVAKMITSKVESASAFQWQSQLRHRYCILATLAVQIIEAVHRDLPQCVSIFTQ